MSMHYNYTLPPYARALGMNIDGAEDGVPIITMPFGDNVIGRPGFLHGGAMAGLLEIAAMASLYAALDKRGQKYSVKQVNVTVDFMRGGANHMSYAIGKVNRLGRQLANVEAEIWQEDRKRIICAAQMHYMVKLED